MKLQKDNIKFIKNMIQCVFIFVWSYYAYVTIYNSTLFQIYSDIFGNGVSSNQKLPAEFMNHLPNQLEIIIYAFVIIYIVVSIYEYIKTKNLIKEIIDICLFIILAICIKIPQYMMIGFYIGNEIVFKYVLFLLLGGIILMCIIRSLTK